MRILAAALCLLPGLAWGQAAVQQSGSVTNNTAVMWAGDHKVRQAAGSAGDVAGKMITGGISAVGDVCSYSNTTDQSGIALCLDATNGQIVYNGTAYPISSGGGNVVGPGSTTANEVPAWNNTSGTLLKAAGARQFGGSNAAFLFDPDQATQQQFKATLTKSGTAASNPSDAGLTPLLWFRQEGALVGRGLNSGVGLGVFEITDTGTLNNTDSYVALAGNCNLTTTRSGAGWTACIGATASARAAAAQGGVLPGASKGEIHGLNIVAGLEGTATGFTDVIGTEIDIVGTATTSQLVRQGVIAVDFGDGAGNPGSQGTEMDAAFVVANRASVGWKNAFYLTTNVTQTGGAFPLSNDGCILCTDTINAALGIDLTNVTISSMAFRGPGGTFSVTGAGDVIGKSITATGGVIVDTAAGVTAGVDFRAGGVSNWVVGRESTTQDFIIKNNVTSDVLYRVNSATGATSVVSTGNMTITPSSTKSFTLTTSGVGGTLNLATGVSNLAITLGGGNLTMTGLPAVAAGTGKRFLCIDTATKIVYEGSGASCN